jgi:hypothetical protein
VARAEQVEAELSAKLALLTATLEEERALAAETDEVLCRKLALSQQGEFAAAYMMPIGPSTVPNVP